MSVEVDGDGLVSRICGNAMGCIWCARFAAGDLVGVLWGECVGASAVERMLTLIAGVGS